VSVLDGAEEIRDGEETLADPDVAPEDEGIVTVFTRIGFDVHPTDRAPFKTVSENERRREQMLTGHSNSPRPPRSAPGSCPRWATSPGRGRCTSSNAPAGSPSTGPPSSRKRKSRASREADELRDLILDRSGDPAEESA